MRGLKRGLTLVTMMIALLGACCGAAAQVATTTIQDTVYRADGTPAGGTIVVSWPAFTTAAGQAVAAGNTSVVLGPNGVLSLALTANVGATPDGSYYTAVLHLDDGTTSQQYWVVPVSGTPVTLATIESQVLPTSVAMQTASRSYVDAKIAQVQTGAPTGTTYVPTTGGTMTGPLVLPGDPVTPTQAADKHYRALNGQIMLQPAGSVTHNFSDADGTLSVAELQVGAVRELANDVTLSGAEEPAAYISESFVGDGTTTVFSLTESAYRDVNRTLLNDSFDGAAIDTTQWSGSDPGSHISLGAGGLTLNGSTGQDGQTTLTALDALEIGGSIVVELGGVVLGAASAGVLAGLYAGPVQLAACFAGFRVRQSTSETGGVTILVPMLNGVEVGTTFTPLAGHAYTLRLRLHSVEMQRVMQRYYCMADGVVQGFGSLSGVSAPCDVVFELVDEGASSNTPATVLYDSAAATGTLPSSPATCAFAAVNATQIFGSIRSVNMTRTGSAWVVSTLPNGTKQTRLIGAAGEGVDCEVSYGTSAGTPGKVTFLAGRVPVVGEMVTVEYRNQQRAIARIADGASVAAEAQAGAAGNISGTSRWLGKVLRPVARSSADCETAAQALLAFATSRTAAVAGSYVAVNPSADIWSGDVLAVTSDGVTSSLLVRSVEVKDGNAVPEIRTYAIKFANDWATQWADGLGLKLSESIAADAFLPATAETAPAQVLANLQQLNVTSVNGSEVQMDAGCDPPAGGGFEVRRRDWSFGADVDTSDLVLRSPVRNFSIPRAAQVERYYVRMYDASSPAVYSRFSSAVFLNVPLT